MRNALANLLLISVDSGAVKMAVARQQGRRNRRRDIRGVQVPRSEAEKGHCALAGWSQGDLNVGCMARECQAGEREDEVMEEHGEGDILFEHLQPWSLEQSTRQITAISTSMKSRHDVMGTQHWRDWHFPAQTHAIRRANLRPATIDKLGLRSGIPDIIGMRELRRYSSTLHCSLTIKQVCPFSIIYSFLDFLHSSIPSHSPEPIQTSPANAPSPGLPIICASGRYGYLLKYTSPTKDCRFGAVTDRSTAQVGCLAPKVKALVTEPLMKLMRVWWIVRREGSPTR